VAEGTAISAKLGKRSAVVDIGHGNACCAERARCALFRKGHLSSQCCLQLPLHTNNTLKADLEVEGNPPHLTVVLQCLDIAAIDEKWHEIDMPDARYCLTPYIRKHLPAVDVAVATGRDSGFSGAHNCSSVVSTLLRAGVPKGACNVIQPGLPDMHCHNSQGGRRLCMHSWAEQGGDALWSPHQVAKFAMRLKEQEIAMLSRWLGVEVERQAQTLNTVPLTRVAIAENRPLTAFDWAPPSWFQSTGYPAVIRDSVFYTGRSEVTPEKGPNLRCTRTPSYAHTHAKAKRHAHACTSMHARAGASLGHGQLEARTALIGRGLWRRRRSGHGSTLMRSIGSSCGVTSSSRVKKLLRRAFARSVARCAHWPKRMTRRSRSAQWKWNTCFRRRRRVPLFRG
jgi:hypothetical protein